MSGSAPASFNAQVGAPPAPASERLSVLTEAQLFALLLLLVAVWPAAGVGVWKLASAAGLA